MKTLGGAGGNVTVREETCDAAGGNMWRAMWKHAKQQTETCERGKAGGGRRRLLGESRAANAGAPVYVRPGSCENDERWETRRAAASRTQGSWENRRSLSKKRRRSRDPRCQGCLCARASGGSMSDWNLLQVIHQPQTPRRCSQPAGRTATHITPRSHSTASQLVTPVWSRFEVLWQQIG